MYACNADRLVFRFYWRGFFRTRLAHGYTPIVGRVCNVQTPFADNFEKPWRVKGNNAPGCPPDVCVHVPCYPKPWREGVLRFA